MTMISNNIFFFFYSKIVYIKLKQNERYKLTSLFWDNWRDDKEETELGELFKREFNKGEEAGVGLGEWDAEDLGDVSWDFAISAAISISVPLLSGASAF